MDVGIIMVATIIAWAVLCGIISILLDRGKKRMEERKQIRELHAEVCRLRVALERVSTKSDYKLDALRTELAIKELLLRQKWADSTRR